MIQLLRWLMVLVLAVLAGKLISKIKLSSILGWLIIAMLFGPHAFGLMRQPVLDAMWYKTVVFCQVLFPEKSVEIPCFRQGIFPTFGGH